ncbi:MAG: hypothetical protein QXP70_00300 [Methanomassiliicoccales archaeon]
MTDTWDFIAINSLNGGRIKDRKDYMNLIAIEESRKLNRKRHIHISKLVHRIMRSH